LFLPPLPEIASIVAVVTLAGCVQGCIGFGMALIAAPILVLIDPALVPGPLMASGLVLVILVAARDRAHADFQTVRWAMGGNVAGAAIAAWVLTLLDPTGFSVLFGLLVLVGVAISAWGVHIRVSRRSTLGAGLLGGFMATTSSIGGPPMALLYQHSGASRFRGTLAAYFIVSSCIGLAALGAIGRFGRAELELSLLLIPGQVLGFLLSSQLTRVLREASVRPFVLVLSTVAALAVLARVVAAGS
jgi:uncharacterized membrane protein YfcA